MGAGVVKRASGARTHPPDVLAPRAAYELCVVAARFEIADALTRTGHDPVARDLLDATARECEGDIVGAEATLRGAAERAAPDVHGYVVDLLAPLLVARSLYGRAAALAANRAPPELESGRLALLAHIAAATGDDAGAQRRAAEACAMSAGAGPVQRMRVGERLARAALCRRAFAEAQRGCASALREAHALGADRAAAAIHGVAEALHRTGTGRVEAQWRHALLRHRHAVRGGDAAGARAARASLYEMAVERGRDAEVGHARALIEAEPMPARYGVRFGRIVGDALVAGWRDDFVAARDALSAELRRGGATDGERALARALHGLAALALGDERTARADARAALAVSVATSSIAADEVRRRRIARALATRAATPGRIATFDSACRIEGAGPYVEGYARFVAAARRRLARRPTDGPLTPTEIDVLRLVAAGRTASQIATLLGRSTHTVRTHLRNVGIKLETHGREEAVARARALGVLPPP
ncbi:MAG TPA: helix-turn-helix transcriptional regulator [Candidatus Baltobacteraceae bacterium]|nr:helix-turn-helix transcriptional regulator [Candidatus Baltobacteraceae bacterium]